MGIENLGKLKEGSGIDLFIEMRSADEPKHQRWKTVDKLSGDELIQFNSLKAEMEYALPHFGSHLDRPLRLYLPEDAEDMWAYGRNGKVTAIAFFCNCCPDVVDPSWGSTRLLIISKCSPKMIPGISGELQATATTRLGWEWVRVDGAFVKMCSDCIFIRKDGVEVPAYSVFGDGSGAFLPVAFGLEPGAKVYRVPMDRVQWPYVDIPSLN